MKIKKILIKFVRAFVFGLLFSRIIFLKLRHVFHKKKNPFSYRKMLSTNKLHVSNAHKNTIIASLFSWDISENSMKIRMVLVIIGFLLLFLILSIRLIIIASTDLVDSSRFLNRSDMSRADILDRNGNLLAVNLPAASLYAKPHKVVDVNSIASNLHKVFPDLDETKALSLLNSNKKFVWIKRDITPKQQEDIYNLGMPGLEFEREQKRIYIYGNLLSHVLGYVGRDMEGLSGVEKYFDKSLFDNNNLQLSIDVRVQNILSEEMDKTIKKFHAKGAAGIVVDPNNGEIIAIVSKPGFDPHQPGKAQPEQMFNMVTQGVYEMGSGMKILTVAIGLDTNTISMNDAYDLSYLKVGKFRVKDFPRNLIGWHSVPQLFFHSSNVGVSQIMLEIGKNNLRRYLKKLKLLDQLNLEIQERARPLFPNYSRWDELSLVTMSYGYAISESPAHFVQALMPVINGGIIYPLTLIKKQNGDGPMGERIFSEKTSLFMRQMIRLVVTNGTGKKAEVKGYYVGGKTGTAEKLVDGKYDKANKTTSKRLSSFFGIMPASKPKFMVYVIFDEPQGIKESYGFAGGGWVAAPTVGAIFERIAVLYGMNKLEEDDPEIIELNDIDYIINGET